MKIKHIKKITLDNPKQYYDVINANPYNNFLIKTNSGYIGSHNCFFDEISFQPNQDIAKQKEKAKTLVSTASARMQSRFMKGEKNPTLLVLASSKRTEQSYMETFIANKKKQDSKTTLVIDEPQWVIRTDKDSPNKFKVAIGNKFLDSEVLPLDTKDDDLKIWRDKGYQILDVPMGYYEAFVDDIDIALTDIAGISTSNTTRYIAGSRLSAVITNEFKNAFIKDVITVGNAKDDLAQYKDFFNLNNIDSKLKSRPLYIHYDMSISGDKTGLAGVWIVSKKPRTDGQPESKELFYRVPFVVSIKAPKGYQISFEKNRQFIYWLKEQGFNIKGISSDTFQSADTGQQLAAKGFDYKVISVDRVDSDRICKPYQYIKSTIYEERIQLPENTLVQEEFIGLQRDNNGKVDHDPSGVNSKDSADAITGAVWNASQNAEQFAFDFGEDINTTIDVSKSISSSDAQKRQINIQFEEQLKDLLDPIKKFSNVPKNEPNDINQSQVVESNSNNTNNNVYKPIDFGFGSAKPWKPSSVRDGIIYWG